MTNTAIFTLVLLACIFSIGCVVANIWRKHKSCTREIQVPVTQYKKHKNSTILSISFCFESQASEECSKKMTAITAEITKRDWKEITHSDNNASQNLHLHFTINRDGSGYIRGERFWKNPSNGIMERRCNFELISFDDIPSMLDIILE